MPMTLEPVSADDGILTVKVTGQLTAAQWHAAQSAALDRTRPSPPGSVPVLVVAEDFLGWERGSWPDSPLQAEFDRHVRRLAIVAEPRWQDLALLFTGKGLRRIPIEFFVPSDVQAARRWLISDDK